MGRKRLKSGIARLSATVGVAGVLGLLAGLVLSHGPGFEHFLGPWDLAAASCIAWLALAPLVKRRGRVGTALIGVLAVVLIGALKIVGKFGVGLWSAEEEVTVAQGLDGLALMMTMQLAPTIVFSGWVTFPVEILTAFLVRRIMKPSTV